MKLWIPPFDSLNSIGCTIQSTFISIQTVVGEQVGESAGQVVPLEQVADV